jgi:hypothetical protein
MTKRQERQKYEAELWELQNRSILKLLPIRLQHALGRGYHQGLFDKDLPEMDIWDLYKLYQKVSGVGEKSMMQLYHVLELEPPSQEKEMQLFNRYMKEWTEEDW